MNNLHTAIYNSQKILFVKGANMDYTQKIPENPSLAEIPKAEKFSEAKLNDFDSWEDEIFVEEEPKDEYSTMKGLTESMFEVFKILGMPQTLNPNFKTSLIKK